MILITGAAGKTGQAVLRKLADREMLVRALVYRREQIGKVTSQGAYETLVGDMRDASFLRKAFQGINSVYHICPNVHPDEIAIGKQIIKAASEAGTKFFVYHSVLHPQIEAMPHHWNKMRVEELLFQSGLTFAILQPAVYMQNILVHWEKIIQNGSFSIPYNLESRISMVDLEDVAETAAAVIMDFFHQGHSTHAGTTYELVGTRAMSQVEVAAILSQQLERPVKAQHIPTEAWKSQARDSGLIDSQIDTLVRMFEYYEKFGFSGNQNVLRWLLNREPTSFETFIKRIVKDRLYFVQ